MNAFDLNVEHARRIYNKLRDAFDVLCKIHFVALLDLAPFFAEWSVQSERFKCSQLIEICHPIGADCLCDESCELRVGQQQEPSMTHAVCFVAEFMAHDI